jgi:hypothetical protein
MSRAIIEKFALYPYSGARRLAAGIAVPEPTVRNWLRSGSIPAKHHAAVLAAAGRMGVALEKAEFFCEALKS